MKEQSAKISKIGMATALVCFLSNLSQLPLLVGLGLSSTIAIFVWLCFTGYCVLYGINWRIGTSLIPLILCSVGILSFLVISEFVSGMAYLSSSLVYPFFLSMFILFLGYNIGEYINKKDLEWITFAYIAGAVFVGGNIFFEYLINADVADRVYAYASKNSIAQILLTAFLLLVFCKIAGKKARVKVVSISLAMFFAISILLLKSRATIFAFPFLLLFAFLLGSKKDKYFRWKVVLLITAIVVYFVFFPQMYESIINDIILGGRGNESLDEISSGRVSEWESFFDDLGGGWLWGIGAVKRESLILTSILSFGFPIGLLFIGIALVPLFYAVRRLKNGKIITKLLFYIAFCYFINSIFEQLAPFGPGVKCYFLWLIFGFNLAQNKQKRENKRHLQGAVEQ